LAQINVTDSSLQVITLSLSYELIPVTQFFKHSQVFLLRTGSLAVVLGHL